MHDEKPVTQTSQKSIELGYEDTDVSLPILTKWFFGLIVMVAVSSVVVLVIYWLLIGHIGQPTVQQSLSSVWHLPSDVPKLQDAPEVDIKKYRATETAELEGYGHKTDGDKKDQIRIPVSRAMELVLQSPSAFNLKVQSAPYADNVTVPVTDRGRPSTQPGNVVPRVIAPGLPPEYADPDMPVTGPDNHYLPQPQ